MKQLLAKVVTILWAFILVALLLPDSNGSPALHTFLLPGLWWLVAAGAVITFLFFIVSLKGDQHSHSHVKSRMGAIIKLLLLIVPASFIVTFSKAEYGTDGLASRLVMKRIQKVAETPNVAIPRVTAKDSLYHPDLGELLYAPESFYGQRVKTIGMMYLDSPISDAYLYCFRYVMVCCAADALPVGVFIDKPDTIAVESDAWYEVEGIVRPDSVDGYFIIKMDEAIMRPVESPKNPWLYPR